MNSRSFSVNVASMITSLPVLLAPRINTITNQAFALKDPKRYGRKRNFQYSTAYNDSR